MSEHEKQQPETQQPETQQPENQQPETQQPEKQQPAVPKASIRVWGLFVAASVVLVVVALSPQPFFVERGSGWLGLLLLLGTLSITPLRHLLLRLPQRRALGLALALFRARRPLGLLTFGVAALHGVVAGARYLGTPSLTELFRVLGDIAWLRHGALALTLLLVLALTSLRPIARRLRAWQGLHRLIYPAALLAGLHGLLGPHAGMGAAVALGLTVLILVARALPRRSSTSARDSVEA
jgi:sulfoxide reductase heme-binding subunit YedZ